MRGDSTTKHPTPAATAMLVPPHSLRRVGVSASHQRVAAAVLLLTAVGVLILSDEGVSFDARDSVGGWSDVVPGGCVDWSNATHFQRQVRNGSRGGMPFAMSVCVHNALVATPNTTDAVITERLRRCRWCFHQSLLGNPVSLSCGDVVEPSPPSAASSSSAAAPPLSFLDTSDSSLEVCVEYPLHGGCTNQITRHINGIMAAVLYGATHVVVPAYGWSRPQTSVEFGRYDLWDRVDSAELLDWPRLQRMLMLLDVKLVKSCAGLGQPLRVATRTCLPHLSSLVFSRYTEWNRSASVSHPASSSISHRRFRVYIPNFDYTENRLHGPRCRATLAERRDVFYPLNLVRLLMSQVVPFPFRERNDAHLIDDARVVRSFVEAVLPPAVSRRFGVFHLRAELDARPVVPPPLEQLDTFLRVRLLRYPDIPVWYVASGIFNAPWNESHLPRNEEELLRQRLLGLKRDGLLVFAEYDSDVRQTLLKHFHNRMELVAAAELYVTMDASALVGVAISSFVSYAAVRQLFVNGTTCATLTGKTNSGVRAYLHPRDFPPELLWQRRMPTTTSSRARRSFFAFNFSLF